MRNRLVAAALLASIATPCLAADPAVVIKAAWAQAAEKGADTSLFMVIENAGPDDAVVRVRCDAANFTELRTVDKGEGFPSNRAVKLIPIAAQAETPLTVEGFHIRLLQLTGTLVPGSVFDCSLRLRGGTQPKVAVTVRPADEKPE